MADGFYLDSKDKELFQWMLRKARQELINSANLPGDQGTAHQEHQAPEVYIARVDDTGLSAAVEGEPRILGSGKCDIYKVVREGTDRTLVKVSMAPKTVLNLSTDEVEGTTWITIKRDKYGSWIAGSASPSDGGSGGSGTSGVTTGPGWVAGLIPDDCLKFQIISASGRCFDISLEQELILEWNDETKRWESTDAFGYIDGTGQVTFKIINGVPTLKIGTHYLVWDRAGILSNGQRFIEFLGGGEVLCKDEDGSGGSGHSWDACGGNTFRVRLTCTSCDLVDCAPCGMKKLRKKLCATLTNKTGVLACLPEKIKLILNGAGTAWQADVCYDVLDADSSGARLAFRCDQIIDPEPHTYTLEYTKSGISFGTSKDAALIETQCTPWKIKFHFTLSRPDLPPGNVVGEADVEITENQNCTGEDSGDEGSGDDTDDPDTFACCDPMPTGAKTGLISNVVGLSSMPSSITFANESDPEVWFSDGDFTLQFGCFEGNWYMGGNGDISFASGTKIVSVECSPFFMVLDIVVTSMGTHGSGSFRVTIS